MLNLVVQEGKSLIKFSLDIKAEKIILTNILQKVEVTLICWALEQTNGKVSTASRMLSLGRTTLVERIRKLGIDTSEFRKKLLPAKKIEG